MKPKDLSSRINNLYSGTVPPEIHTLCSQHPELQRYIDSLQQEKQLLAGTHAARILFTSDGKIVQSSYPVGNDLGIQEHDCLPSYIHDFANQNPEERNTINELLNELSTQGQGIIEPIHFQNSSGENKSLKIAASGVYVPFNGQMQKINRATIRDITTESLATEESHMYKGTHHDVGNIISAVYANLEHALEEEINPNHLSYQFVKTALDGVGHIADTLKTPHYLLAGKRKEQEKAPVDVDEIIKESLCFVDQYNQPGGKNSVLKGNSPIVVSYDSSDLPLIYANSTLLKNAIVNILKNGFEAMPASGGEISLSTRVAGEYVSVNISDNGPGMSKDTLETLFQRGNSTKGENRGYGMYNTKWGIIESGGEMEMGSQLGLGTWYNIKLPINRNLEQSLLNVPEPPKDLQGYSCLLVEDLEGLRLPSEMALKKAHAHVDSADNGLDALELFKQNTYDILITDNNLPGLSGLELAEWVRTRYKDFPILLTTANRIESPHVTKVLLKPHSPKELVSTSLEILNP